MGRTKRRTGEALSTATIHEAMNAAPAPGKRVVPRPAGVLSDELRQVWAHTEARVLERRPGMLAGRFPEQLRPHPGGYAQQLLLHSGGWARSWHRLT